MRWRFCLLLSLTVFTACATDRVGYPVDPGYGGYYGGGYGAYGYAPYRYGRGYYGRPALPPAALLRPGPPSVPPPMPPAAFRTPPPPPPPAFRPGPPPGPPPRPGGLTGYRVRGQGALSGQGTMLSAASAACA